MQMIQSSAKPQSRSVFLVKIASLARVTWLAVCLLPLILCVGCAFTRLKQDRRAIEESLAVVEGQVVSSSVSSYPILVVVWNAQDPNRKVLRNCPMYRPGAFRFVLSAPGEYCVFAFEDRNRDFIHQKEEPSSFCQPDRKLTLSAGQHVEGLRISLAEDSRTDLDSAVDLSSPAAAITLDNVTVSFGETTSISDPRFTQANASMGLWEPWRFLQKVGTGVYFTDSFDPKRTPVLFVHGLSGHPGQWKYMVDNLDRNHFQPWLFFYPSGVRLSLISDGLYRIVETMRARYGFTEILVVAHSMGGLVAREYVNVLVRQGSAVKVPLLVTISTPWGGHEATEMGVKYAPAVVPVWLDMLPGSAFQGQLWETPLPPETTYYMMFSFRGSNSPFMDRNNDGTVTLASELDMRAQLAATRVYGLFEDHVSVLSSRQALEVLAHNLEQWRAQKAAKL